MKADHDGSAGEIMLFVQLDARLPLAMIGGVVVVAFRELVCGGLRATVVAEIDEVPAK